MIGRDVTAFAYPYGHFDEDACRAVEEAGYRIGCSVRSGFNGPDVQRYLLRRIEVFGSDNLWHFRQKLKFGANEVSNFYPCGTTRSAFRSGSACNAKFGCNPHDALHARLPS